MERKIGEIFGYNDEWYQCVKELASGSCDKCSQYRYDKPCDYMFGRCRSRNRSDNKGVIFRKLEKVGEPYAEGNSIVSERMFQKYRTYEKNFFLNERDLLFTSYGDIVSIEIKQKQEDMEEKKLNLKPFDLHKAKSGKPVCTRDGRKARIICFDRKDSTPIVALIECVNHAEIVQCYHNDGKCHHEAVSDYDLMMLPEKKEGWVNIIKTATLKRNVGCLYDTREEALSHVGSLDDSYVATVKLEWEE